MPIDTTQAAVLNGIYFYDCGVVEIPYSIKGVSAVRTIKCNWSERLALVNYLAGVPAVVGGASTPQQYPNLQGLLVGHIEISGEGAMTHDNAKNIVQFDLAVMKVSYLPPNVTGFSLGGYTPDVWEIDFSADAVSMPAQSFKFSGSGKILDPSAQPAQIIPCADLIVPRSGRSVVNSAAIFSAEGKVNSDVVFGAVAETALFLGAKVRMRYVTTVLIVFDHVYHFKVRPPDKTWNMAFDRSTGAWAAVIAVNGGAKPYLTTAMTTLVGSATGPT